MIHKAENGKSPISRVISVIRFSLFTYLLFVSSLPISAQVCDDCSVTIEESTADDIYVNPSETVCIASDVVCSGKVYMQGGTLCNHGIVQNLWLENSSGVVQNYKEIEAGNSSPSVSGALTINNYPLASFKLAEGNEIDMTGGDELYINLYNHSLFDVTEDFSLTAGQVYIQVGITWADDLSFVDPAICNFKDLTLSGSDLLSMECSGRSDLRIDGTFALTGAPTRTFINNGLITVTHSLNIGNGSIINNGKIEIQERFRNTGGNFSNEDANSELYVGDLFNQGAGIFNNKGKVGAAGTFSNNGQFNLFSRATVYLTDYYNDDGTISGPVLDAGEAIDYENWARIFIDGYSSNAGPVTGHVIIYDNTLENTDDNAGFGFDAIENPTEIDGNVLFSSTSLGSTSNPPVNINCASFFSEHWMYFILKKAADHICPGKSLQLNASLAFQIQYPGGPPPTPLSPPPTFSWIPGNLTGTLVQISPTVSTVYTVTASFLNCPFTNTIAVNVRDADECPEEIIGCCFGNYGASVWINNSDTYVNVYCNLINELGKTGSQLQQGDFESKSGYLRVLLNWYHNAKNLLYIPANSNTVAPTWASGVGVTSFFGADQKIKGNSSTSFNNLWLDGTGPKSIWVNTFGHAGLQMNDKVFLLQNHVFAMKNYTATIGRSFGYATTDMNGYFSRVLEENSGSLQKYLFPLGATATSVTPFRYRPLVAANNSTVQTDEVSANFMNTSPSLSDPAFVNPLLTNTLTMQSPSVPQVNKSYYHKIKNTTPPLAVSDLSVKSYYHLPSEGFFQSLAEWEKGPAAYDWWGTTPGANSSSQASGDPETLGLMYAQTTGTLSFAHIPFALAKSGFYINTSAFGNQNNSGGTTFSVSGSAYGGGGTPTGGGLGSSFGTGNNSGNNGGGGVTTFTPSPVAGEYVITIASPDNCQVPGKIRFIIDQNGIIQPSDVLYGISGVSGYLGQLSDDVYTIDQVNTGLTLVSTPKALLKECVNSITVCTSGSSANHIVDVSTNNEDLVIKLPSTSANNVISYGTVYIFDKASTPVAISPVTLTAGTTNTISPPGPGNFAPGVYRFEFLVIASSSPPISETIRGQFIVK